MSYCCSSSRNHNLVAYMAESRGTAKDGLDFMGHEPSHKGRGRALVAKVIYSRLGLDEFIAGYVLGLEKSVRRSGFEELALWVAYNYTKQRSHTEACFHKSISIIANIELIVCQMRSSTNRGQLRAIGL